VAGLFSEELVCQIGMCFCYCISMLPTMTRMFQWNMCPSSTYWQTSPVICNFWTRTPIHWVEHSTTCI